MKLSRQIGPQDHACSFYRDTYHQLSIAIPYLREALRRNERCLYLMDDITENEIINAMESLSFDLQPALKRHRLTFHPIWETHFRDGGFNPADPIAFYTEQLQDMQADGYRGLSVVGVVASSVRPNAQKALAQYERDASQQLAGAPISAICMYHEGLFSRSFLNEIRTAHPLVVANQCPYFVDYVRECDTDRSQETIDDVRRTLVTFCSNANFDQCPVYHRMSMRGDNAPSP